MHQGYGSFVLLVQGEGVALGCFLVVGTWEVGVVSALGSLELVW